MRSLQIASLGLVLLFGTALTVKGQEMPPEHEGLPVAETTIWIGATAGVTFNEHTGNFRIIEDPSCPLFTDGTGTGYLYGLSSKITPSSGEAFSLLSRLTYERRPATFSTLFPSATVLLPGDDPTKPRVVTQSIRAESSIEYDLLNTELLAGLRLVQLGPFERHAQAGPALQYVLATHMKQTQSLIEPAEARFINAEGRPTENDGRILVFHEGEILTANDFRLSLKTGLQAKIRIGNMCAIAPGFYYDLGLTEVSSAEDWKVHSWIGQVDFWVGM